MTKYKLDFFVILPYNFAMSYIIAGLGNPGEEYTNTRHNTGAIILSAIANEYGGEFNFDKKINANTALVKIGKEKVTLVYPQTFMNLSGKSIAPLVKSAKAAEKLIVIYDDFSLPIGKIRISFNRSSGGHNGLESIIKAIKTEAFVRIRIGTAKENAKGHAKLLNGEDNIEKFILGKFKDEEIKELKKVAKSVNEAVMVLVNGTCKLQAEVQQPITLILVNFWHLKLGILKCSRSMTTMEQLRAKSSKKSWIAVSKEKVAVLTNVESWLNNLASVESLLKMIASMHQIQVTLTLVQLN
jgi:PTH1 family peptidyl-tRNA hydrolase